jgi:hypothetical protein
MGNLDREIDLMLERSQRRYECLDQQIDLMLEGSLEEYVRAVDLKQSTQQVKTKETQDKYGGLPEHIVAELTGVFRLVAVADFGTSPIDFKKLMPDFVISMPENFKQEELKKFLGYRPEPTNEYHPPETAPGTYDVPRARSQAQAAHQFVYGIRAPAPVAISIEGTEHLFDFGRHIKPEWRARIDGITEHIKLLTKSSVNEISRGAIADAEVLPSKLSKTREYQEFYSKTLVPRIGQNQTKINNKVREYLKDFDAKIESYLEKYKTENNQETRAYGYTNPPRPGADVSRASWNGFLKNYRQPLVDIYNKAMHDWEILLADPTWTRSRALTEGKLATITIDFNELRKQKLNESFLAMFGGWVEYILGAMFSGRSLPLSVKGSRREVESFAKAIGGEKSYLEVVKRYGLDHPTTYKNRAKLDNAIKGFERETGLKWPFK